MWFPPFVPPKQKYPKSITQGMKAEHRIIFFHAQRRCLSHGFRVKSEGELFSEMGKADEILLHRLLGCFDSMTLLLHSFYSYFLTGIYPVRVGEHIHIDKLCDGGGKSPGYFP